MSKKLLSWLLLCCMLVTVFPLTVLSVDTQTDAVTAVTDSEEAEEKKEFTVTFITDGKTKKVTVAAGETVAKPKDPKKGGLFNDFAGWTTSVDGGTAFDFDTPITGDVTLYAHWGVLNTREISQWEMMLEETQKKEDEKVEESSQTHTLRVKFVDKETGVQIPLEQLFGSNGVWVPQFFLTNEKIHINGVSPVTVQAVADFNTEEMVFAGLQASPDYFLWIHQEVYGYEICDGIQTHYFSAPESPDDYIIIDRNKTITFELEKSSSIGNENTLRVRFVDSATYEELSLTDIFAPSESDIANGYLYNSSYIGLSNKDDSYKAGGFLYEHSTSPDAIQIDGNEIIFKNVPSADDYYVHFDASFVGYALQDCEDLGNYWSYGYFDITDNTAISIPLDKTYLIVGDTIVTTENCIDILGDGTAKFEYEYSTLTLTNANISADYVISTNMEKLNLHIPEGSVSTLTIVPDEYRDYAAAIEAERDLYISGGGELIIKGNKGVYAINEGYYSWYATHVLDIYDVIITMDSSNTIGIQGGDITISNAGIYAPKAEDYGHLIVGASIDISNSDIDMVSHGGNLIWSRGGDINISNSTVNLIGNSSYCIFAEGGNVSIVKSDISIKLEQTESIDPTYDRYLLAATKNMTIDPTLEISDGAGNLIELYEMLYDGESCGWSLRYPTGKYPANVSIKVK